MTDNAGEITDLVAYFLPMNRNADDSIWVTADETNILASSLASFATAASFATKSMDESQRNEFCRRVAAMPEGDGKVQTWMVEAALRSVEGDPGVMTGIDPVVASGLHMLGLILLTSEYLRAEECHALRAEAERYAQKLRPGLASLPR